MPADLHSGKTLTELSRDFAHETNQGEFDDTGRPIEPTMVATRAMCRRYVNDGLKLFCNSNPDWTFVHFPYEFSTAQLGDGPDNIAKDPGRYRLPTCIRANPQGNLRFCDANVSGSEVVVIDARRLEQLRQTQDDTGIPLYACGRPVKPIGAGAEHGWELVLWPKPDRAYRLSGTFRLIPYDLRDDDERHFAGASYDHAILSASLYLWSTKDDADNPMRLAARRSTWERALEDAKALDSRNRPRKRGRARKTTEHTETGASWTEQRVLTRNGVPMQEGD